ncbi:hypothetical protein GQ607_007343 [Colletotrichum asianum]|uniref:Uncharacterized protein n=1 Tax=Colletotrichum asianum TaxID=702518 RepID=A0A8H3WE36_9PEZI|nr:hypothetical protein GQ607_007343 [Colletotrichum asianum]
MFLLWTVIRKSSPNCPSE